MKIHLLNKKQFARAILISLTCLFILFILPRANALGITPGRTTLNYEPEFEKEIAFSVLNSEYKSMKVSLIVEGELKEHVTLSEKLVEFSTLDYNKEFSYKVKLPESLKDKPGLHTAEIIALELAKETDEGTHIGATVAVVSQLYIYVPCHDKCIEADLNVLDAEEGKLRFIVAVINRGEQKINEVKAVIDITSLEGEKIDTIETNTFSLEPKLRTELNGIWNSSVKGEYIAKVKVFYDDSSQIFEKKFSVGEQILFIERVWVSDFSLGEIAKFRILVENKWNQELKNVFANLIVYDKENYAIADVKSASENILPLDKKELVAYWDTAEVEEGTYNGKLMIKYNQKSTDKDLILKITQSSLDIVGYAVGQEKSRGISLTTILIGLVALLLIANILWFVIFRKMTRKKKTISTGKEVIKL